MIFRCFEDFLEPVDFLESLDVRDTFDVFEYFDTLEMFDLADMFDFLDLSDLTDPGVFIIDFLLVTFFFGVPYALGLGIPDVLYVTLYFDLDLTLVPVPSYL